MADHIRYDLLTQQALRGVVRAVLTDAAKKGLPGDHHFYIAFDTKAEGVHIPDRLHAQYPEQMTIILQHQFWDLKVTDEEFEVGLSFGGIPAKLTIPFAAVQGFFDPSVQFGLQFEEVGDEEAQRAAPANAQDKASRTTCRSRPRSACRPRRRRLSRKRPPRRLPSRRTSRRQSGGAEVVRLDRFRKK